MPPFLLTLVGSLLNNNLPKVAQAVVDKGLDYVQDKLGLEIKPDPDGNLNPDQILQIRMASMKHEEFKIEQDNKNTADARDMQKIALQQSDIFSKRFVYYLASFWSIFSAVYISFITFGTIPTGNVRFADTILGFLLGTVVSLVLNYFMGSSNSSNAKNIQISQLQDALVQSKDTGNAKSK